MSILIKERRIIQRNWPQYLLYNQYTEYSHTQTLIITNKHTHTHTNINKHTKPHYKTQTSKTKYTKYT